MNEHDEYSHFSHREMVRFDVNGNRKVRDIYTPDEETMERHNVMLRFLYNANVFEPVLQDGRPVSLGGTPGATILDNVLPHQSSRTFYALDIKNAFPSVDIPTLKQKVSDAPDARGADYIQLFIDEYVAAPNLDGLPVGAPCSPYLFNLYCNEMDEELRDFCDEKDLVYTRWLDDITISSFAAHGVLGDMTRRSIREIIERTPGMVVNHTKSKLHQRVTKPVTITGVSLYPDGRLQPSPMIMESVSQTFDEIEAEIYDPEAIITDYHVARLNGYHGALVGMSREPYSELIKEFIDRYHVLVRLAHAAIAMEQEPQYMPDPERKKFVRGLLKMIEVQEYRAKKDMSYKTDIDGEVNPPS